METQNRKKQSNEVFGISSTIHDESYVDRGQLDELMRRFLNRETHIALKAPSKAGKTWLRKKVVNDPIEVQCRIDQKVDDIYIKALGNLGIELTLTRTISNSFSGSAEAKIEAGAKIFARAQAALSLSGSHELTEERQVLKQNISSLEFIAECIKESGRRLVIEDFHYLPKDQRQIFAFEMKALWELGVFVVVVGVWEESNYLLILNPDLSGKVEEISITWTPEELASVLELGGSALNVEFSSQVSARLTELSYGSVGTFQALALKTLDDARIDSYQDSPATIDDPQLVDHAAEKHARQIESIYANFAKKTANGMRRRKNSTGIYAYAMAAIMSHSDRELIDGVSVSRIYSLAHERQPRIQQGNLRSILGKLPSLHTDQEGRGLILQYSEDDDKVSIVDHQLLLYRRFRSAPWPWDTIIDELQTSNSDNDVYNSDS